VGCKHRRRLELHDHRSPAASSAASSGSAATSTGSSASSAGTVRCFYNNLKAMSARDFARYVKIIPGETGD